MEQRPDDTKETAQPVRQRKHATYGKTICQGCGCEFVRTHHKMSTFHDQRCKKDYHIRAGNEGRKIVTAAKAWRLARHARKPEDKEAGKQAFRDMCLMLDGFIAADKAAGRPGALSMFRRQVALWLMG